MGSMQKSMMQCISAPAKHIGNAKSNKDCKVGLPFESWHKVVQVHRHTNQPTNRPASEENVKCNASQMRIWIGVKTGVIIQYAH